MEIKKANRLQGTLTVPGDKSISHRAVMLGALAEGKTRISHFLEGADCLSTIACFRSMGIDIERQGEEVVVQGKGLYGLCAPASPLDVGNSGTTIRLISGILAGQAFESTLTGDSSIKKRPMKRIMEPLSKMGAHIESLSGNGCAPLHISGRKLTGIHYQSPVASAQVKSCLLLAGMYADSPTTVTEPFLSRNHSEIMLRQFGAELCSSGTSVTIQPSPVLKGQDILVPGDISSAAYFIAAACLVPGSEVLLKNVGINPTRDGFIRAVRAMGGSVTCVRESFEGEPCADLLIKAGPLHGTVIEGSLIPTLIDEIPVLAVMAAFAEGETVIRDAAELRVKESDRIAVMAENLSVLGADVTPLEDGMVIRGGRTLRGGKVFAHGDHRVAMSMAVAGLMLDGGIEIEGGECVAISYPGFFRDLASLVA